MNIYLLVLFFLTGCSHEKQNIHPKSIITLNSLQFQLVDQNSERSIYQNKDKDIKLIITQAEFPSEHKAKSVYYSKRLVVQSFFEKATNPYYQSHEDVECSKLLKIESSIKQSPENYTYYFQIIPLDSNDLLVDCREAKFWTRDNYFLMKNKIMELRFVSKERNKILELEPRLDIFF